MSQPLQGFEGFPSVEILDDGVTMRLLKDFVYNSAAGERHVALAGLETDGGTVPPPFWAAVGSPWTKKRRYGYLIHDQECKDVRKLPRAEQPAARLKADLLLYEICLFYGDTAREAQAIYVGVRIGWYKEYFFSRNCC
jgi:hypothetical protein